MRLLEVLPNGNFRLEKFPEDALPPYAILSHTWLDECEEVNFEDMMSGSGLNKAGYEKIKFCGEQTRGDGLRYCWVDSCCINKSISAELQEALSSMFRWYQRSTKCYVYLSDVSVNNTLVPWEQAFRESRWFTRGWTLQELLAPRSVEFFSQERQRLGNKDSLRQAIHEATCIPMPALEGTSPSHFSVKERFSWTRHRQTKVEEDRAYSLLGLFGVSMIPIYSEGATSAFKRLQEEIDRMEKCMQALHLTDPRKDKKRIEESRGGLLKDSYRWILEHPDFMQWRDEQQGHLLWIKGDPGKGKTMLLCGIIDELKKLDASPFLLSYFFCQATDSRINNATAVLRGLLYLLMSQQPSLISHIQRQYDHAGHSLFEDSNAWITVCEVLTNVFQDPTLQTTYLVIDALDECTVDLPRLLDFISQKSSQSPRLKWLVSSRNWPEIEGRLNNAANRLRLCLELNAESVSTAVDVYIKHKVHQLAQKKKYDDKTQKAVLEHLSLNANETFLWVALVCQNLETISRWNVRAKLKIFPPGLDLLYQRMMDQILDSEDSELCMRILATTSLVYEPITPTELASLLEMHEDISEDMESLEEIISLCGSFLVIRQDTIYFVHQSAKDYLIGIASAQIFPSGKHEAHYDIFSRSIQVLYKTLRRDIYDIRAPGRLIEEVETPNPDPLAAARYSCVYWVDHLLNCDILVSHQDDCQTGGIVDDFLKTKYLYWLEALSLCKSMSTGVLSIAKLETLVKTQVEGTDLIETCREARRYIMYYKPAIESCPLQAYVSTLIFSPSDSLIRSYFQKEEPKWVTMMPPIGQNWSPCLATLEGHSSGVNSATFSHDSTRLASASYDYTVRIWDASSGACLRILDGHSHYVNWVTFSHDSTRLASASDDHTVRLWNSSSDECIRMLEGHSDCVISVAFSHDSNRLASASVDKTVKVWDTSSGKCIRTLKGHSGCVNSVAFSHDSTQLASASSDHLVRIWDASSGECLRILDGHSYRVNSVTFSHDSTRLATASDDRTVRIWNASSGECLQKLFDNGGLQTSVAFSPDSMLLAAASRDGTLQLWNVNKGEKLQTFSGHNQVAMSVGFSPDSTRLVSSSRDHFVRIWDAGCGESQQKFDGHGAFVRSVALSNNTRRLVSAAHDGTMSIWNVSSGECLQELGRSATLTSVSYSPDSTRIASSSLSSEVNIWDASTGEYLQRLQCNCDLVWSLSFSSDSRWLASASEDGTVQIWDIGSGECLHTLNGDSQGVSSVAFSHDSAQLASGCSDCMVRIWDISSGVCLETLEGHHGSVSSVAFSHDSTWLASASKDRTVRIWDAGSGTCLRTLDIGQALTRLSFDTTSSYLHTDIGCIVIDALSPKDVTDDQIAFQPARYHGVGLSPRGNWITYNSENLVWLPSEYRPSSSVVSGRTIGVGVWSGRVWMCDIETSGFECS